MRDTCSRVKVMTRGRHLKVWVLFPKKSTDLWIFVCFMATLAPLHFTFSQISLGVLGRDLVPSTHFNVCSLCSKIDRAPIKQYTMIVMSKTARYENFGIMHGQDTGLSLCVWLNSWMIAGLSGRRALSELPVVTKQWSRAVFTHSSQTQLYSGLRQNIFHEHLKLSFSSMLGQKIRKLKYI